MAPIDIQPRPCHGAGSAVRLRAPAHSHQHRALASPQRRLLTEGAPEPRLATTAQLGTGDRTSAAGCRLSAMPTSTETRQPSPAQSSPVQSSAALPCRKQLSPARRRHGLTRRPRSHWLAHRYPLSVLVSASTRLALRLAAADAFPFSHCSSLLLGKPPPRWGDRAMR